jgi:hypothetical protein
LALNKDARSAFTFPLQHADSFRTMLGGTHNRMRNIVSAIILLMVFLSPLSAAERSVRVFIALCDNKTQGIIPVGAKIGDGDAPDENLYWGCDDGFGSVFKHHKEWTVLKAESDVSPIILRRMTLKHRDKDVRMIAEAYRGSAMKKCLEDFERAAASGEYDLVAFIGHNGLMDHSVDEPKLPETRARKTNAMVLCCQSAPYFRPRLERMQARPILLTQQLMYPGAFILRDALEVWMNGGSTEELRTAAGRAYAKNQNISVKAATGVFAPIPTTKVPAAH